MAVGIGVGIDRFVGFPGLALATLAVADSFLDEANRAISEKRLEQVDLNSAEADRIANSYDTRPQQEIDDFTKANC